MKKYIAVLFAFCGIFSNLSGQLKIQPESAVTTGILYDLVVPFSGIARFDGSEQTPPNTLKNWSQVYFELTKAALKPMETPAISEIKNQVKVFANQGVVPIGALLYHYNFLNENLEKYADGAGNLNFENKNIPEKLVFTSCALRDKTYNGQHLTFTLSDEFIFSNFEVLPQQWFINFDDGNAWQQIIPGKTLEVSYVSTGTKTIKLKAVFKDGHELFSSSSFNVIELVTPNPTTTWAVQGEIPYQGVTTSGEAFIYLAEGRSKVVKPIVVSEGIDFDDALGWEEIYNLLNQENLLENLRAEGFDAVILNFAQPLNYMQQNAFLYIKLLQMVNDSIGYERKIVTIGPSMGQLVIRYALTYMENNNMDHNSSLFIAMDGPNQGANIPLGLQYLVYFYKDYDANIGMMLDALNQPSPKQMLSYIYTDPPSASAGHDPLYDSFRQELLSIGNYPDQLRKIAVSDGSIEGIGLPFNAGDQVISYNYSLLFTTLKGNVWSVKNNASGQILQGQIKIPLIMNKSLNVTVFSSKPYDNAPGGYRTTFAQIDSIDPPLGDIIALHDNHCFVSTVSAFDLNVTDLFYNIAADPDIMEKTPYDTIYWASQNEEHVHLTPYLAGVIYDEIMNAQKETQQFTLLPGWNEISSFLQPTVQEIPGLISPIETDFVILQHFDEIYWPAGNVNTTEDWDLKKGYVIKVNDQTNLSFQGIVPDIRTVPITAGWNLISVLSKKSKNIQDLFGENLGKIEIIKNAICTQVYWPSAGVTNLKALESGKAYYIKATEDFSITF